MHGDGGWGGGGGSAFSTLLEWSGDNSVVRAPTDWQIAGSSPCRSGGRIFVSVVNFLCWLLFRCPFHPRVTAVARKRSRSFCQSAGGRLQLNTHTPYVCGCAWSDMVHGCMVYTERAETAAVSYGTSHVSAVNTPPRWIFNKTRHEKLFTLAEPHASGVRLLEIGKYRYIKMINNIYSTS